MKSAILTIVLFALTCHGNLQVKSGDVPAVAYESNGVVHTATATGHNLKAMTTSLSIGSFAISPDAGAVVFTPLPKKRDLYGGQLFLLRDSSKPELLTRGPYYNKSRRPAEVYSDPDYAPDGARVVFSIHSQPTGDLVEASGPFAILELKTKKGDGVAGHVACPRRVMGSGLCEQRILVARRTENPAQFRRWFRVD